MKRAVAQINRRTLYEYDLESYFLYLCYNCGLRQQSYIPIVASGPNGAVLHYNKNTRAIEKDDILLIDAGAEAGVYGGYGSDITRTYPIRGKFSADQAEVYNIVLETQNAVINQIKDGFPFSIAIETVQNVTLQGLLKAGFIRGEMDDLINNNILGIFLPHGVSHYLGLDVHDADRITANTVLRTGHYLTVEPGVYFNNLLIDLAYNNSAQLPLLVPEKINKFRNFGGVRIEDDILVTETGYKFLSLAPREISDIEAFME
eukprot:TRINITY_DN3469_c0_g1_i1.p1 TRINITY_DN3469_c0_g1~~TRINITY_DN3469_c0_g1_i1.p1  ORF type:complete len:260 (+),score=36.91 TRINITY_DN3469_c0_g1_i1:871-1650(+)